MQDIRIEVLSNEEIKKVVESAFMVLETVGIGVKDAEARDIFSKAGCQIGGEVVRISADLTKECLGSVPNNFVLCGRDSRFDVKMVSDGSVNNYINLGIGTRTAIYDGEGHFSIRNATLRDEVNFAKVLESCSNINWFTQPASAMDLIDVKCARSLHEVDSMISNCAKPFLPDPDSNYIDSYFDMMKIIYGGDEEEAIKRPFMIIGATTSSPLQMDVLACQHIIRGCRNHFPIMTMTMEMSGTTSPIHLAGTLVLHVVEAFACIVLTQLCRRGTPMLFGTATTGFDFMNSTAPFGSPEAALLSSSIAQIAQYLKIPSITTGGGADSIYPDVQSGHESTLTGLMTLLSGSSNIFGSGLVELGMSFSLEELILRDEMIDMERFVKNGLRVDDETLSLDLIREIGIGGDFISCPDTMSGFSNTSVATTFNRSMYDEWLNKDRMDALERAHNKVKDILLNYQSTPIDNDVRKELDEYIVNQDLKAGATQSTQDLLDSAHYH